MAIELLSVPLYLHCNNFKAQLKYLNEFPFLSLFSYFFSWGFLAISSYSACDTETRTVNTSSIDMTIFLRFFFFAQCFQRHHRQMKRKTSQSSSPSPQRHLLLLATHKIRHRRRRRRCYCWCCWSWLLGWSMGKTMRRRQQQQQQVEDALWRKRQVAVKNPRNERRQWTRQAKETHRAEGKGGRKTGEREGKTARERGKSMRGSSVCIEFPHSNWRPLAVIWGSCSLSKVTALVAVLAKQVVALAK